MKRIISLVFLVCSLFACAPKDKNVSLVRNAFKDYVQKTFDDPKSLEEIIEIVPSDTISLEAIRLLVASTDSLIETSRELYHLKDSIWTEKLNDDLASLKKARNIGYSDAFSGQLLALRLAKLTQQVLDAKKSLIYQQDKMDKMCDSLTYRPALFTYSIKYRKQYPDGLKLETVYAYVDSLSGFKSILAEKNDSEMMNRDYFEVFDISKDCMISLGALDDFYHQYEKLIEEFEELVLKVK